MEREDLARRTQDLFFRVRNINNWILENPNTDPNLFEMTECLMDYGNITSLYMKLIYDEESAKGNKVSNYDIRKLANLYELDEEIRKMMKLRGVISLDKDETYEGFPLEDAAHGFKAVKSEFFSQNKDASHLLNDIYYLAIIGSYPGEPRLSREEFEKKKAVFARVAGVSLYTWQEGRKDVNFTYSNQAEFEEMRSGLEELSQIFDEAGVYYYEGGYAINSMFEGIKQYGNFDEKKEESSMQM